MPREIKFDDSELKNRPKTTPFKNKQKSQGLLANFISDYHTHTASHSLSYYFKLQVAGMVVLKNFRGHKNLYHLRKAIALDMRKARILSQEITSLTLK